MNGRRMERLRGNRARELLPAAGLITEAVLSSLHKYKYSVTSAGSPFCSSIYCTGLLPSQLSLFWHLQFQAYHDDGEGRKAGDAGGDRR